MKKLLSKSQINTFIDCPLKWKFNYIDKIKSFPSPAMKRGIDIHKKLENAYKNITLVEKNAATPEIEMKSDVDLIHFINMERKRILSCVDKDGKFDEKYFKPLFQELKLSSDEMGMRGIVDAVYIHPADDGVIVLDWKTGKYYGNNLDGYRFELAVYAELLKKSGKVDNVKYWAIYFSDQDKLFFEKVDPEHVRRMYETIERVRTQMESGNYPPKKTWKCRWCSFKSKCPLMNNV